MYRQARTRLGSDSGWYEMTIIPANLDIFDTIEKVAKLKNKGVSDTAIGKQLGLQRKEVVNYYADYKTLLRNDSESHELAKDLLNVMIKQYDELIYDTHKLIEKIRGEQFDDKYANQEAKALGMIGDFIAKRLDLVQKAGLLEASDIGDEYAEMQEKTDLLIGILRSDLCTDCKMKVKDKLSIVTNKVESVVIYD